MAAGICTLLRRLTFDGVLLSFHHAMLFVDDPEDASSDWHVAVLGLRTVPAAPRGGQHEIDGLTHRGGHVRGRVVVGTVTPNLEYVFLSGVGPLIKDVGRSSQDPA